MSAPKLCRLCESTPKNWEGGDRECAFPEGDRFTADNWRCATVARFRYMTDRSNTVWSDDQSFMTISMLDIGLSCFDKPGPLALWVPWYKERGNTEQIWLTWQDGRTPTRPSEDELLAIACELGDSVCLALQEGDGK